ncbi:MAG: ABC transporter substrate-binding protein [Defluviitaleaceae bacterium]|nr:ABC transporter substrate-binding protein [Defluviitaleaceae bacterium]MCL2274554.1 ABC transporter substrate-binding protein [Defluviitaleaceae bacterium]
MLKYFYLIAVFAAMLALTGCGTEEVSACELPTVRVAALRGPTALGMLDLMDRSEREETENAYTFELVGAPVEIPPMLARGEVDIAAVPGNLAAVLYNQMDGAVQALAVVTLGVLHIVDATGEVNSVADLAGRTIFATGEGATPEFALNYVLKQNGLIPNVDVFIQFRAEPPEIAALFELGQAEVALLPEPFASSVVARFDHLRVTLDWTTEWERVQADYGLVMSVVIARREFIENYPRAVEIFMQEYAASIAFMSTNTAEGAQLAVDAGLVPNVDIGMTALPRTNMVFLTGDVMRRNLMGFYRVLYNETPASVGGQLPDDNFFFIP